MALEDSDRIRNGDLEQEIVELFVRLADLLGVPRSIGELYGALFASERPLAMDDLLSRLRLSKGAVSQGLKFLRGIGAVQTVYRPGDRRDHYVPVVELRRFVSGFLRDKVRGHLQSGGEQLDRIQKMVRELPESDYPELRSRADRLARWRRRAKKILPLLLRLIEA